MPENGTWPYIGEVVNCGGTLKINDGGYTLKVASLYQDEQLVCMFECSGMDFERIMQRLEELARRYVEEGVATDAVNGTKYEVR
ncbi:MAG: hypothetical protein R6X33_09615 [Candidatus Brocadiia bacterium]